MVQRSRGTGLTLQTGRWFQGEHSPSDTCLWSRNMTVNLTENDFWFFFFGVSCRVRPGGGGSDADSLDLDRMKQVKKVQKTPTTSQSLKQRCVCFLNLPCVLACYNKNNLFFSKVDCFLLERVQQWLKKYVMCNEHWWVFWCVSFAFRKSWKRCFVNCTKWRMKSSMVRLICSWNTHEG